MRLRRLDMFAGDSTVAWGLDGPRHHYRLWLRPWPHWSLSASRKYTVLSVCAGPIGFSVMNYYRSTR